MNRGYLGTGIRGTLDRLDQQVSAESSTVVVARNGEAGEEHHSDLVRGQPSPGAERKCLPPNSTHRECVVTDNAVTIIEQHERT